MSRQIEATLEKDMCECELHYSRPFHPTCKIVELLLPFFPQAMMILSFAEIGLCGEQTRRVVLHSVEYDCKKNTFKILGKAL